jgi:hypothetical protein
MGDKWVGRMENRWGFIYCRATFFIQLKMLTQNQCLPQIVSCGGLRSKVDGVTCHNGVDGGDGLISDVLVPDQDKRLPKKMLSILS